MYDIQVVVTHRGRHFHVSADCVGLWQGWTNNINAGHSPFETETMAWADAVVEGKFACKRCHKTAGLAIPAYADFKQVTEAKRAAKAARKAAEQEAAAKVVREAENIAALAAMAIEQSLSLTTMTAAVA